MQKFSYHTHTNSLGIFDGRNTAAEMIKKAEEIGYTEIGISNHICCHENYPSFSPMFFNDFAKAEDVYLRVSDEIKAAAEKSNIKVYVGFEVDFFQNLSWQKQFEKLIGRLKPDYLIGSTHTLHDFGEKNIYNLYDKKKLEPAFIERLLDGYWDSVEATIASGYFDIIAHIDLLKIFGLCTEEKWNDSKRRIIEALAKHKQVYEVNTSGWRKAGEQHPQRWMLEELNRQNVPVVISDDAHSVDMLGQYYSEAEFLLSDIGYKNRWKLA